MKPHKALPSPEGHVVGSLLIPRLNEALLRSRQVPWKRSANGALRPTGPEPK